MASPDSAASKIVPKSSEGYTVEVEEASAKIATTSTEAGPSQIVPKSSEGDTVDVEEASAKIAATSTDAGASQIVPKSSEGDTVDVEKALTEMTITSTDASASQIVPKSSEGDTVDVEKALAEMTITSTDASASQKMIILKSSEDEIFEVEEAVAFQSETIKKLIQDSSAGAEIPLPRVTSNILNQVIKYCRGHAKAAAVAQPANDTEEYLKLFDNNFLKVDNTTLFEIILAADYLGIASLYELTCQHVADMIKDMTVEGVRKFFKIKSDFSEDDEKRLRRENQWAEL